MISLLVDQLADCYDVLPPDNGTTEFLTNFIRHLPFDEACVRMSEKVKWTRWGSHHWSMKELLPERAKHLLKLLIVGIATDELGVDVLTTLLCRELDFEKKTAATALGSKPDKPVGGYIAAVAAGGAASASSSSSSSATPAAAM